MKPCVLETVVWCNTWRLSYHRNLGTLSPLFTTCFTHAHTTNKQSNTLTKTNKQTHTHKTNTYTHTNKRTQTNTHSHFKCLSQHYIVPQALEIMCVLLREIMSEVQDREEQSLAAQSQEEAEGPYHRRKASWTAGVFSAGSCSQHPLCHVLHMTPLQRTLLDALSLFICLTSSAYTETWPSSQHPAAAAQLS